MTFRPRFAITNATAVALSNIERTRGFMEAAKPSGLWVAERRARIQLLDAHHCNRMDGGGLTVEQSARLLAGHDVDEADPEDSKRLVNCRDALEFVAGYIGSTEPVSEWLIREINRRLVRGLRGGTASPGEYRSIPSHVVDVHGEAVHTPPASVEVPHLMVDLVTWLNTDRDTHPVLMAGIAQYELMDIHPFREGCGRTSRMLSTLCLYRSGYDLKRLFTMSEYYGRDPEAYYQAIRSVRGQVKNLTGWLEYFVAGLAAQAKEVREGCELLTGRDTLLAGARDAGLKDRPVSVLGYLLEHGKGTVAVMEAALGLNRRTLQRDLNLLEERGLVREVGTGPTDPTKYYEPLL